MYRHIFAISFLLVFGASICFATHPLIIPNLDQVKLRNEGPAGLEIALWSYDLINSAQEQVLVGEVSAQDQEKIKELKEKIDQIAGQRHATVSRLYWYTDLERAKQQSKTLEKPILSLRLLGKLTDEYSCANSRFFRTALYANKEISDVLREHFVLHWQSVRPVPRVTIDFRDGRKIERTITGNSAHYALSTDGTPLDVLPGLYGPKEFLGWLDRVETLYKKHQTTEELENATLLVDYHQNRVDSLQAAWLEDIKNIAPELLEYRIQSAANQTTRDLLYIDSIEAKQLAYSKMRVELPIIRAIKSSPQKMDRMVSDTLWQRLALLHKGETNLDKSSVELMRQQNANAFLAGKLALGKAFVEDPILRVVRNFEDLITLDTVRNEYLLHRQIHIWFADGEVTNDLDSLNEKVYSELFLTPSSDPWLGLVPPDSYAALENDGLQYSETLAPSNR